MLHEGSVHAIIGREAELAAVDRFLDSLQAGAAALVIEGEAGIGKTTVWREAVRAAEPSLRVLEARPAESEAKLSYAALADLVGDAFDEARGALPAPQERALAAALLRAEAEEATDPRTTATALVGVLKELSGERPLVVAVDDVQWLDAASARALEFVARRLPPRVGLLLTDGGSGRGSTACSWPRDVQGSPAARPTAASLARVVAPPDRERAREITRAAVARAYRRRLRRQSVLRARDRARVAFRREQPRTGRPPAGACEPSGARSGARAGAACTAQKAVLVAAALSRPTVATVAATLSSERTPSQRYSQPRRPGFFSPSGERLRFTHPLLASAVYGAVSPSRRRQLHGRLAEVVANPEERARHLAASVTGPTRLRLPRSSRRRAGGAPRGAPSGGRAVRGVVSADAGRSRDELARRLGGVRGIVARRSRGRALAGRASGCGIVGARAAGRGLFSSLPSNGSLGNQIATEQLGRALAEPRATGISNLEGHGLAYLSSRTRSETSDRARARSEPLAQRRARAGCQRLLIDRFWAEATR